MTTPQPTYTLTTNVYIDYTNDTLNTTLEVNNPEQAQYPEVVAALTNTLINTLLQADPRDYQQLSNKVIDTIQETFTDENIQHAINNRNEN